jgi:hypothetical protein
LTYVEGLRRTLFFPPKKSAKPATSSLRGWGYGHEEDDEQIFG